MPHVNRPNSAPALCRSAYQSIIAMLVELSIIPIGNDPHTSDEIAVALKVIEQSGLFELTPSATCIEGEWAEVMPVIQRCHEQVRARCSHVVTTIKIEDEAGAKNKLRSNVPSVEDRWRISSVIRSARSVELGAEKSRFLQRWARVLPCQQASGRIDSQREAMKIQRKTFSRPASNSSKGVFRVAAVQFRSGPDPALNVTRMIAILAACSKKGVHVAAFPECAVTSYVPKVILAMAPDAIRRAESELTRACRRLRVAAIVGTADVIRRRKLNAAVIVDANGRIKARYYKEYLVGADRAWHCLVGKQAPPVYAIRHAKASVIICHDNRHPELCRLPVLAGARIIFYLSHECNLTKRFKLGPCRAQVQARAVENSVFVVHANAPSDGGARGSHGETRIVDPDGNILLEASQRDEEILIADLDLRLATRRFALKSLRGPHSRWWRDGMRKVPIVA
jgi:uncharacterized protein (TIGR00106 family)